MTRRKCNAILMAIIGAAFGVALLIGERSASATSGYYCVGSMAQSLVRERQSCSAWCGNSLFTGTSWASGRTVYGRSTGSLMSGGGTAHVKAHAGCRRTTSDITVQKSAWTSADEAKSTTCPSDRVVVAHDCEIELANYCADL